MPDTARLLSHFYVKLGGSDAPEEFMRDLMDVTVDSSLHLPDVATLMLHDPHLTWIDDRRLDPGTPVVISARVGADEHVVFDGEIVELEPSFESAMERLVVRAFDRMHRLTRGRHVRSFQQVTDSDLVEKLAREVGLRTKIAPMTQVHDYVFQHNETNLAFLRGRAAMHGYLLFVHGQTLHCEPPGDAGEPTELAWGSTLGEFHPRLTTLGQSNEVRVHGWDPSTRQAIVGQAKNGHAAPHVGQSGSGGDLAQSAFSLEAQHLVTDRVVRDQRAADRLAQALADQTSGTFIAADGVSAGNPQIVAGSSVKVTNVGNRFGGTYFVTAATHLQTAQGYTTQFSVSGLNPVTLLTLLEPDGGQPPASPLVIGVVTDNQDPDGQGRVKVQYPSLSTDHASDWARVVVPGGGPQRGLEFLPEVNDEVLVGFELGDVHYPYVLGGLWNGRDAPPKRSGDVVSGGKVQQRVIRTRSGHQVVFDDGDGTGGITIQDRSGNKLVLDSSANSLTIEVQGDVSVKASGNLALEAQGQVTVKGAVINLN